MQENFIQDFLSTVEYENIGKHPDLEKITIDQINDPGFIKNKKLQEIIINIRVRKLFQLFCEEGKIQELNKEVNGLNGNQEKLKEKNDKDPKLTSKCQEREIFYNNKAASEDIEKLLFLPYN